ncbi:hypothetical protein HK101_003802 [Irineochytrium annulatum]|nr:hypothetical protein HK101_003802 [Irineochytrium annulatum]
MAADVVTVQGGDRMDWEVGKLDGTRDASQEMLDRAVAMGRVDVVGKLVALKIPARPVVTFTALKGAILRGQNDLFRLLIQHKIAELKTATNAGDDGDLHDGDEDLDSQALRRASYLHAERVAMLMGRAAAMDNVEAARILLETGLMDINRHKDAICTQAARSGGDGVAWLLWSFTREWVTSLYFKK